MSTTPRNTRDKVNAVPDPYRGVNAYLVVNGAAKAIEFYEMARRMSARGRPGE